MLKASYWPYTLKFKAPAITSRQVMTVKDTYFIKIWDTESPTHYGLGECALFRGLSCDDTPDYEAMLANVCADIESFSEGNHSDLLAIYPSIRFGLETALNDLRYGGNRIIFPGPWGEGRSKIVINGLVWMGNRSQMVDRVEEKIRAGFHCIKLKIGGISFDEEVGILMAIRQRFSPDQLEIRLDANGAFTADNAMDRLNCLAQFEIHSIEQPVKAGQLGLMAQLCCESPIPIAFDEELIGVNDPQAKRQLLEVTRPAYIILKPALCGGFSGAGEWIEIAESLDIKWWATSALESNIGLNAIAQWISTYNNDMPQGLGTGNLYVNNIPSPITQIGECLIYDTAKQWIIP